MIACKRHHLESRCRERGVTIEQAWPCVVTHAGDDLVVDESHPAYPKPARGLGDLVADGLAGVGITKERVNSVAKLAGISDCGCVARQAALNALGKKLGLPPGRT